MSEVNGTAEQLLVTIFAAQHAIAHHDMSLSYEDGETHACFCATNCPTSVDIAMRGISVEGEGFKLLRPRRSHLRETSARESTREYWLAKFLACLVDPASEIELAKNGMRFFGAEGSFAVYKREGKSHATT